MNVSTPTAGAVENERAEPPAQGKQPRREHTAAGERGRSGRERRLAEVAMQLFVAEAARLHR